MGRWIGEASPRWVRVAFVLLSCAAVEEALRFRWFHNATRPTSSAAGLEIHPAPRGSLQGFVEELWRTVQEDDFAGFSRLVEKPETIGRVGDPGVPDGIPYQRFGAEEVFKALKQRSRHLRERLDFLLRSEAEAEEAGKAKIGSHALHATIHLQWREGSWRIADYMEWG